MTIFSDRIRHAPGVAETESSRDAGGGLQVFATAPATTVLRLRLVGELDFANAGGLRREVNRHLAAHHRTVRLHLDRLRFCDCAGLQTIVDLHNTMLRRRGVLYLHEPSPPVRRLLEITELHEALHVTTS